MTIQIGRLEQLYAKIEATYAAQPTFTATDAFRHLDAELGINIRNRTNAPDRLLTPDQRRRTTHKTTASWDLKNALMWPSGTLGTAPEHSLFLEHGLGTKTLGTATTTVSASPSPTTTGFTVASPTGIAVGTMIAVNLAGVGIEVRMVTGLSTAAVTVNQAFSAAPTSGDTVKTGVQYTPASNLASSFALGSYITTNGTLFSRQLNGCVVEKLGFQFDANSEPMFSASGPACDQTRPAQAQPGGFTTVGTGIPTGLTGALRVSAAAYPFLKAGINIQNSMKVRNAEYGLAKANGFYRSGRRSVDVSIDAYVEDPAVLYALGESSVTAPILIQTGNTSGQIIAVYMPAVEFEIPTTPSGDGELTWSFKGTALGTAGNDEIYVAYF